MSIIEMSHRSKEFMAIVAEAEQLVKELLQIPDGYRVLFLQGGASTQFGMVPMNFLPGGSHRRLYSDRRMVGKSPGGRPQDSGKRIWRRAPRKVAIRRVPDLEEDRPQREPSVCAHYVKQHDLRHPMAHVAGVRRCADSSPICRATFYHARSTSLLMV